MVRNYFDTPNYAIPVNFRGFSSNLCLLIIRSFYPEISKRVDESYDEFREIKWHSVVPQIKHEDLNKPVAMLFMDPVIRYFACCRKEKVSFFNSPLDLINNSKKWFSFHFWIQSRFLLDSTQPIYLFKFPEHVNQFCDFVGIDKKYLPIVNKRPLTRFQLNFLDNHLSDLVEAYEDDFKIYQELANCLPAQPFSELNINLNKAKAYYSPENNYLTLLRY